jgi:arsenate reductase (thioredoxin)
MVFTSVAMVDRQPDIVRDISKPHVDELGLLMDVQINAARSLSICLALFAMGVALCDQATPQSLAARDTKQVVFVCEHGSVKSLVAMVYFNRIAKEQDLPYRAVARGTAPDDTVPTAVREGLGADGFDVTGFVPRLLQATDVDGVALVVSFDQDISSIVGGKTPYLRWNDLPGPLSHYLRGRDAIISHVDALVAALSRGTRHETK